jgi:hypothetical protein
MAPDFNTPQKWLKSLFSPSPENFTLNAEYFPKVTQSAFSLEEILKWEALPLGFKVARRGFSVEKKLNVGLLNPDDSSIIKDIQLAVLNRFESQAEMETEIYRILPNEFRRILIQVYGLSESDPRLAKFI